MESRKELTFLESTQESVTGRLGGDGVNSLSTSQIGESRIRSVEGLDVERFLAENSLDVGRRKNDWNPKRLARPPVHVDVRA